jgi:hypothetical protein
VSLFMSQMLDYILKSLRNSDLHEVSSDTGISIWTLRAIKKGERGGIENPGIKTAEPLFHYLKRQEAKRLRRRAA